MGAIARSTVLLGILTVLGVGATSRSASACCWSAAYDAMWPADGSEDVPLDAALTFYRYTWGESLDGTVIELQAADGAPVSLTTTVRTMGGGYFLLVAVPDEALRPATTYEGVS